MGVRRWADLPERQKATLLVAASVQLSLAAAAWTDLARRPADQVRGSKAAWAVAIAVNFVGPLNLLRARPSKTLSVRLGSNVTGGAEVTE